MCCMSIGLLGVGVLVVFVVLTRRASVFLPLKAIFTPVCLNRLVTFMMLNMTHFSFFLGCAG